MGVGRLVLLNVYTQLYDRYIWDIRVITTGKLTVRCRTWESLGFAQVTWSGLEFRKECEASHTVAQTYTTRNFVHIHDTLRDAKVEPLRLNSDRLGKESCCETLWILIASSENASRLSR